MGHISKAPISRGEIHETTDFNEKVATSFCQLQRGSALRGRSLKIAPEKINQPKYETEMRLVGGMCWSATLRDRLLGQLKALL
jgi:hypothetical protein